MAGWYCVERWWLLKYPTGFKEKAGASAGSLGDFPIQTLLSQTKI
jgi:hypothetical protein